MSVESIQPRFSFMLRAARAIAVKRELSSEHILVARHMARDGASTAQILDALGLAWNPTRLQRHLAKLNIRPRDVMNRCHFGEATTLPSSCSGTSMERYRPKQVRP